MHMCIHTFILCTSHILKIMCHQLILMQCNTLQLHLSYLLVLLPTVRSRLPLSFMFLFIYTVLFCVDKVQTLPVDMLPAQHLPSYSLQFTQTLMAPYTNIFFDLIPAFLIPCFFSSTLRSW